MKRTRVLVVKAIGDQAQFFFFFFTFLSQYSPTNLFIFGQQKNNERSDGVTPGGAVVNTAPLL